MFYEADLFPFTSHLAGQWQAVRDELNRLSDGDFHDWPEHRHYGDHGWETFGLYAFGRRQPDNCAKCPHTDELLREIPGLMMAGFSRLAPGTHIKPHRGYEGYAGHVLRLHLGLNIPDGCALRVGTQSRTWAEGACLVFDDSAEHEAWNRSDRERAVLLIDFLDPFRKRPSFLNPKFSPELINFIDQQQSRQSLSARLSWIVWKALHPKLVAQARQTRDGIR